MLYVLAFHVVADLVWIGSILACAVVLAKGGGDARVRGESALAIYHKLAVPSFVVAFVLGVVQLGGNPAYYFKTTHWMHAKLPLALAVIAIHHVLGARARRMATGKADGPGPAIGLAWALAICAAGSALLALIKPF